MNIGGLSNGLQVLKTKTFILKNGYRWNKMTVGFSHFGLACVRESVSDSGYGHDDISCMTYDIHVDILLECVFAMRPLHVHLGGE